jgi:hypothetical protein
MGGVQERISSSASFIYRDSFEFVVVEGLHAMMSILTVQFADGGIRMQPVTDHMDMKSFHYDDHWHKPRRRVQRMRTATRPTTLLMMLCERNTHLFNLNFELKLVS